MKRRREEILRDALAHFQVMETYSAQDTDDQLVVDAICMRLSAGLEVLADLDEETREDLFAGQWILMWGMRNRIAHGYLLVDSAIVRQTLRDDMPQILGAIRHSLEL